MIKKKIKVAVVYNEASPEMYDKHPMEILKKLVILNPTLRLKILTPMEEYEYSCEETSACRI